jgi:hypothetical protein
VRTKKRGSRIYLQLNCLDFFESLLWSARRERERERLQESSSVGLALSSQMFVLSAGVHCLVVSGIPAINYRQHSKLSFPFFH